MSDFENNVKNYEDFKDRVNGMREYFKNQTASRYPLCNEQLKEKNEYEKSMYMRMLCMVVQYGGNTNDEQVLYIERLAVGAECEENTAEYMKKALETDTENIKSFIELYREDELRFFFAIDAMLLLAAGGAECDAYGLLGELIEMLGIAKSELTYLAKAAGAIAECSSEKYDNAYATVPQQLVRLDLSMYLKEYYTGVLNYDNRIVYVYAPEPTELDISAMPYKFEQEYITFENVILKLEDYLRFYSCIKAKFINCTFLGADHYINCYNIGSLEFENCLFRDFTAGVALLDRVNKLTVKNCLFEKCSHNSVNSYEYWNSVIFLSNKLYSNHKQDIIFEDNQVINCVGKSDDRDPVNGIIIYAVYEGTASIRNNKFITNKSFSCENYSGGAMFGFWGKRNGRWNITEENNECIGQERMRLIEDI